MIYLSDSHRQAPIKMWPHISISKWENKNTLNIRTVFCHCWNCFHYLFYVLILINLLPLATPALVCQFLGLYSKKLRECQTFMFIYLPYWIYWVCSNVDKKVWNVATNVMNFHIFRISINLMWNVYIEIALIRLGIWIQIC